MSESNPLLVFHLLLQSFLNIFSERIFQEDYPSAKQDLR